MLINNNLYLFNRIPSGTSPELADLLLGLLRRNARDRIPFDSFFNHPFLQRRPEPIPAQSSPSCPGNFKVKFGTSTMCLSMTLTRI